MNNNLNPRLVVCAAIKNEKGDIICGPRHGDCFNFARYHKFEYRKLECGFVDQEGRFMNRKEAWKVADQQGQIRNPTGFDGAKYNPRKPNVGDEGLLFSENLY